MQYNNKSYTAHIVDLSQSNLKRGTIQDSTSAFQTKNLNDNVTMVADLK